MIVGAWAINNKPITYFQVIFSWTSRSTLRVPQERIADRLAVKREKIRDHLAKLAMLPNSPNSVLQKGFTVAQVAEKHGWPESLLWSIKMESREDIAKCHKLKWGIRTWDNWYWTDCDKRFGDEWPVNGKAKPDLSIFNPPYFSKS